MERGATREEIDAVYRSESPRVLSTLIRLVGDFDLAEDALHDAFSVALQRWPKEGVPANPRAWLISTGRFKAVDTLRRESRLTTFDESLATEPPEFKEEMIQDDLLRLVFCCCHPALPSQGQVALTLREVCGLTTDEIARAFLATPVTVAQRIVRAKAKIRDDKIPYEIPASDELPGRLDNVLRVTYLVFNEGYYSSSGETLTRVALSNEAI
ncbi:MAG: sigma-70 family RNA polymerase sigma factor, partial [bacterium]